MPTPPALDETFEALVVDWDGSGVAGGPSHVRALARRFEELSAAGVHTFVVSDACSPEVDRRLGARPPGPGRLHLCGDRGAEVVEVTGLGPVPVHHRSATAAEGQALDRAAKLTVAALRGRGRAARIAARRSTGRTVDVVLRAEPADPATIADVPEMVAMAVDASLAAGLSRPRIVGDGRRLEIGLTGKSDSARFATEWLAGRGITGQLVLVACDDPEEADHPVVGESLLSVEGLERAVVVTADRSGSAVPPRVVHLMGQPAIPDRAVHLRGGPSEFLAVLDAQLTRRRRRRVPRVDTDPDWVVELPATPALERVAEAMGAVGNGWAGSRASLEEEGPGSAPLFSVAGAFGDDGHLLHGPTWTSLVLHRQRHHTSPHRFLDLRTGTLYRDDHHRSGLRSLRFVSAAAPHVMAMRAEGNRDRLEAGEPLRPPANGTGERSGSDGGMVVARTPGSRCELAVAARDRSAGGSERRVVERLAAWSAGRAGGRSGLLAARRLAGAEAAGFDALLAEHRRAWARNWSGAEVAIEGGAEAARDQLAARFSVFHLLAAAAASGEAAVGARGLTGDAYAGHVFWDADVFVLPALAAIHPRAARAMLEYRIRRLPAARELARRRGYDGARFPWESADTGADVTPLVVRGPRGEAVRIATGTHEEHIVADVAWSAACYAAWTGDSSFLVSGPGRALFVETARYWASRLRLDPEGRAHLYGVMGPDEYHQVVDDNAYTNVMARWNLRRGADLLARTGNGERAEVARWRDLAERLVDGWVPRRGLYEQFAGYFDLEPLLVSQVARPPVAVDLLIGARRVAESQLIKQADVLMLHLLVPDEVEPGSLGPCLDFYEPRTAHGSSLSPAVSATLLARAGRPDAALDLFRTAARLDLDDVTGTTADGLHLATMGGVWQALAHGFLGIRPRCDELVVDPHLPEAWTALSARVHVGGRPVTVRATHEHVSVSCDRTLPVRVGRGEPERCEPPGATYSLGTPTASTGATTVSPGATRAGR
jgi:trehalose/maltose hydrolase-like predicted phosphorylase